MRFGKTLELLTMKPNIRQLCLTRIGFLITVTIGRQAGSSLRSPLQHHDLARPLVDSATTDDRQRRWLV